MAKATPPQINGDGLPHRLPAGRQADLAAHVAEAGQVTVASKGEENEL